VAKAVFGGMPQWLLEDYLIELGGARTADGAIAGEGWHAILTARRDGHGAPGLGITRVEVRIEGSSADATLAALRTKAQRGGG